MCLVLLALDAHPRYALVLAANRDEFHRRPALPADWLAPGLLGGRDLEGGGTWLGLRRDGRFALVTNFREPGRPRTGAPSRGRLPLRVLEDPRPPATALEALLPDLERSHGCNLLAGSPEGVCFASSHAPGVHPLEPGIHGLSNHLLDTPWPKVARGRRALASWIEEDGTPEGLFALLGDRREAPDAELPRSGVSLDWERRLSPAFIVSPDYGTRCSTVLLLGRDGEARFHERSFGTEGQLLGERRFQFPLED
ncbi:MAG: NRDE family protein [Acidobacteria bacterium]|nr:NRDE family protein [Acidobacteriota bacterium]